MTPKEVADIYFLLKDNGIQIWIDGGWCVDALLGMLLRPHKDLDIAIESKNVPHCREILTPKGYKQIKEDGKWNFVLSDKDEREIDVHVFVYDVNENVVDGIEYPAESLTGNGILDDRAVKCISPKYMVEFMAPWIHKWPEKYLEAVAALCERYKIKLPKEYSAIQS